MRKLKEKLILSYLEHKKRKEPFDASAAELYELPQDADINMNNSHFFTASNVSGETLSIRLGMRNDSDFEIFVLYRSADGRFFTHEKDCYAPSQCPVRFECREIAEKWHISFKGKLLNVETSESLDATIDVDFTAQYPIYDFLYHADIFTGMVRAIAREKWNKAFFEAAGKNNQRHYEQAGRLCGSVAIAGERFVIDLCCVRDHSFGRREWNLMNDHIWFLGVTENDKVLSFSIVNYPAMKRIFSGYTNIFEDRMETLRDYEILEYNHNNGSGPDLMKLRCHYSQGRFLDVTIKRDCNVKCLFGDGCYSFQEGLGAFDISGVPGRGTIEYGFNRDGSRWELTQKPTL